MADHRDETQQAETTDPPPNRRGEIPSRIGAYRVLREIGEGGMGIVYEAEQEAPIRRKVALKLIKVGMDTREVIARFDSERQALALMNHPNIARVYDAGATPEGRPYFAMEYVQGVPITEYCDRHKLAIRDRLKLFIDVCDGVQHAHQKGIIHRDIKPSNVLVTTEDQRRTPKIIDFGVAKATSHQLREHSVLTEFGQIIGTPEFMSPEQAEMTNLDVDTRTDIYSLGVLLYELLAGQPPFDSKALRRAGFAEMQRKLREEEPEKPSSRVHGGTEAVRASAVKRSVDVQTLQRSIAGDLDWITMKALEKDRIRRYQTAQGLALDIERHLRDEPVSAGPPSGLYRARKLFRRHRATATAAAVVVLALVIGVIGTSWALLRAVRAERQAATEAVEARRQTAIAEAVNGFLNDDLLAAAIPSDARGRGKDVTVREVLQVAGERVDEAAKGSGRFAAEPLVEASIRLTLGRTHRELGEYAAAEPHLRRALELRRVALGDGHPETVRATNQLGFLHWRQGRLDEAEPLYRTAIETATRTLGADHRDTLAYEMNLAVLLRSRGRYQEAEPLYQHNLEAKLRTLGAEHRDTLDTMSGLANHFQETGRYEKAEALHRQVVETKRRLYGEGAPTTVADMNNLGNDLASMGRYEEARQMMQRTLELKMDLYGADHPSTLNSVNNLGELNEVLGRDADAEALHRQALDGRTRVLGPKHAQTIYSKDRLASALLNLGRVGEAERLASAAAEEAAISLGERHLGALTARDTHARALVELNRAGEAESMLRRELVILEEKKAKGEDIGEGDTLAHAVRVHLGMALAEQRRLQEAEALLLEAVPKLPAREADTTRAIRFVTDFYEAWNRSQPDAARAARAAEWRRRLEAAVESTTAR